MLSTKLYLCSQNWHTLQMLCIFKSKLDLISLTGFIKTNILVNHFLHHACETHLFWCQRRSWTRKIHSCFRGARVQRREGPTRGLARDEGKDAFGNDAYFDFGKRETVPGVSSHCKILCWKIRSRWKNSWREIAFKHGRGSFQIRHVSGLG